MADDRFKALSTDPRYRLPSRKEARTAVDPRFKRLFTDQDFRKKASVDRYGRKLKPEGGKKDLEKLYRLDKVEQATGKKKHSQDRQREVVGSSDDDDSGEGEEDDGLATKRDPAREGGFSESSSEEEDSSEEASDSEDEAELAEATAGQEQTEEIPMGEVTNRIACVNMDWDNIRASDLMAVASSFAPAEGKVDSVVVYPSEFGRERMEREELEGPPREIFASSKGKNGADEANEEDDEEDSEGDEDSKIQKQLQQEQVSEGSEFDTAALRQYQLERLRYFYAVITCSSESCAKRIYDALDGHEYLNTANFFDLRFIPDDVEFEDDKPREECHKLPEGYRPNEFRTEALTHSKVRLTWDDDDPERKEVQKRAFSRAEIDENDMQAYIGSDSSDAESVTSKKSAAEDKKAKKKEAERAKMRAALGLAAEPAKGKRKEDEPVGDMQITFTSGMTNGGEKGDVFENEPQDEQSTRDRYIRKERERKQKRKDRARAARNPDDAEDGEKSESDAAEGAEGDDLGFDDPFFNDPEAAKKAEKKAKKADRERKKAAQDAKDEDAAAKRAELDLLMADDKGDEVRHFDMRDIEKAEKDARRKGKGKKAKKGKVDEAGKKDDFNVETADPRFKALFESHEYAIDPTNPKYKKTKGMEKLREEGRKKRKVEDDVGDTGEARPKKAGKKKGKDGELDGLVARLGGKKGKA